MVGLSRAVSLLGLRKAARGCALAQRGMWQIRNITASSSFCYVNKHQNVTSLSAVLIRAFPFALRVETSYQARFNGEQDPAPDFDLEHVSAEMDLFYGPQFHVI